VSHPVHHQQAVDKVDCVLGDVAPVVLRVVVAALQNLLKESRHAVAEKGREAAQQNVGDDSDAPHVHLLVVARRVEHLGRHVPGSAAPEAVSK
jgi:hypothetical protein